MASGSEITKEFARDVAVVFWLLVIVDLPWLFATSGWSTGILRRVQGAGILRLWAAALVYVALTVLVFVARNVREAATIGVATYAVYEFTNLATLRAWDWRFSVADSLWGGVLLGATKWLSGV